ncbi:MAG: hypothetical protein EA424_16705 [Planctomycetaceae bacterium]|nr:MAG: hypothetical protein EA424_16705 [Planctomycetaceae bacterium]
MNQQLTIFGALLLSLAAGMATSELFSFYYERDTVQESRVQPQATPIVIAAEVPSTDRAIN